MKVSKKRKGSIEISSDTFVDIGLVVLFIIYFIGLGVVVLNYMIFYAGQTADVVARDIAGLITISAIAPGDIVISYNTPASDLSYSIDIENENPPDAGSTVKMKLYDETGRQLGEEAAVGAAVTLEKEISKSNLKSFTISKRGSGGSKQFLVVGNI